MVANVFFVLFCFEVELFCLKSLCEGLIHLDVLDSNVVFICCRYQSLNLTHVPEHSAAIYEFRWHPPAPWILLHSFFFRSFLVVDGERLWRQMLLRDKKTLKVWDLQGRVHPRFMGGAGQWTRWTNECIMGEMLLDSRLARWGQRQRLTGAPDCSCFAIRILLSAAEDTRSWKVILEFPLVSSSPEYYPAFINHWVWAVSNMNTCRHMLDKNSSGASPLIRNSPSRKKSPWLCKRYTRRVCRSMTDWSFNQPLS